MATKEITLSGFLPATPQRIYDAWLDAKGHSAMTGSRATVQSKEIGGRFTAWAGYIEGTHVALDPGKRIFQSWRATDFPPDAPESYLEVRLAPAPGGTRITFRHTEVPAKQAAAYLKGWTDFYLKPMAKYFGAATKVGTATRPMAKAKAAKPKKVAKRPAAKKPAATRAAAKAAPRAKRGGWRATGHRSAP